MPEIEKGRVAPDKKSHTLTLNERTDVQITGVSEVVSFDEASVLLETSVGTLVLEGTGLRVHTLDVAGGRLAVSGEISGLYYSHGHEGERRRRGLFRT
ncbi:MAG: sporulation protein YabP [Clostridia bacterium]|nr:sporulation protein YabP [Clostridia bacterium]